MTDFKAKMNQIRFQLGLRPRPLWGSLQHSPDPLAGFGGDRFAAGEGAGLEKRRERGSGRGGRGKWRGGKGRAPSYCWTRAPQSLATPLHKNSGAITHEPRLTTRRLPFSRSHLLHQPEQKSAHRTKHKVTDHPSWTPGFSTTVPYFRDVSWI